MIINARFEYVSQKINSGYSPDVPLPQRATEGSAGYDFYAPQEFTLKPKETMVIKTGIRVYMEEGIVLMLFPRSGLGYKYKLTLDNTVGIIDSDYYYSDNEGHIMVKLTNNGDIPLTIPRHTAFCQGVFLPYGIIKGDECSTKRNGGFGSTGQ